MDEDRSRPGTAQSLFGRRQRRLIAVDGQQPPTRADPLQEQPRVASRSQGAVDEDLPRSRLEKLY